MVHVIYFGCSQYIQSAEFIQGLYLLLDGVRYLVLGQQFADAAVLTLGAGAVVAEDIE